VECFQHPENIFLKFFGGPFCREPQNSHQLKLSELFFFSLFFLSIGWEVFLSWFLIKFAAQKKKWGESCGVTNAARFFVQKSAIVLFFSHFFALNCFFVCACYFYKTNKKCGNSLKTYLIRFSFVPVKRNLQCVSIIIQFSLDILFELKSTRVCICVY
jgi:hypothetical protein